MFFRMTELWNYPKYGCPFKHGNMYYYFHNSGLQNQSVLYCKASLEGEPQVFLDPNTFSKEGNIAISSYSFSEDGALLAYSLSESGSDWVTVHFRTTGAGEVKDFPDKLSQVKFTSLEWTHDNKGIFYNRYPKTSEKSDGTETDLNLNQKLYYHVLGTKQDEDVLCCEFTENPEWMIGSEVSDCGRYIILSIRQGCDPVNKLYYVDLTSLKEGIKGHLPFVKIVDNFDAEYDYITNDGSLFTFKTNLNSPNYRLINIDFNNFDEENWMTLVPENSKDVLEWASCVNNDVLVLCYLHDVKSVLYVHRLSDGSCIKQFPLDIGSIVGFSGQKKQTEIFYQFTSFLTPGIIYHCDLSLENFTPKIFHETVVEGFDASLYETVQVFYPSKDGTNIPMFIVHKKNIDMDASHPLYMYGYGGFNISVKPSFSVSRIIFIRHLSGIVAVPNIRGGSEYGERWHKGGMLANKQNCFDDFQYAAEYLIAHKYTTSERIAINGASNGGLLVGACVNQRPQLFNCAVAQVGVMDMLKFHKFTIGHAWVTDYGCSSAKEQFEMLINYSPLHNIKIPETGVQYPSVLLMTADHDDRVVPLHSYKYIAQLQYIMGSQEIQSNPLLILVDTKAGHGAGKPTLKRIDDCANMFAFIAKTINITTWIE
ncbi:prolyl endopeptidase-like isoform X2 [Xenia sp. Carnegie-2017]|uniref:prolyl endopeptidase-like isoform X2 n=1 Tax=Xenia sp. Carnegie-2017 TaxID=2897299 RepID=UPI001F035351|nr:prolyl endopeptidase-like isoform X2 [Xenia sp. Carnegie-2017]